MVFQFRDCASICRGLAAAWTLTLAPACAAPSTIPLPQEAFDSSNCRFEGATYVPDAAVQAAASYAYTLRFSSIEPTWSRATLEARDRQGVLLVTLKLDRWESNGYSVSSLAPLEKRGFDDFLVRLIELNRDFTEGAAPRHRRGEPYRAPYAIITSDLGRHLHYADWSTLTESVTFHTPQRPKPLFTDVWLLSSCGSAP